MVNTQEIRVVGVSKRFGSTVALDDISIELRSGITGLLGPNGAGKTTLLRILATVLAPDRGDIDIFGHWPDRAGDRAEIRRNLGYTPQEPGFHRSFTTFEFVDYLAILKEWGDRKRRRDEVRRVIALVGLETQMHVQIKKLSGGMRRRVAIAQALIGNPALLVLDEPTAGLDPEQRLRFRELLSDIATDSTVLLSTHQTDDVAALCNRVAVLLDGTLRFDGRPSELADLASGQVWSASTRDPSAALAWMTGDGSVRHVGEPPPGAELVAPTIEDGYLTLTGALTGAVTEPA
jgi:ABC-2 type transport system ATP-binding protein